MLGFRAFFPFLILLSLLNPLSVLHLAKQSGSGEGEVPTPSGTPPSLPIPSGNRREKPLTISRGDPPLFEQLTFYK